MTRLIPRREIFGSVSRFLVSAILLAGMAIAASPAAMAASPAESFVQDNINKGLAILNNKALSSQQRADEFESFLTSLTDMKRIGNFTLGQYRRGASPADLAAFNTAFQNYAVAVYRSYFNKYAGQTLRVVGSQQRAADDVIVNTQLINPNDRSGQPPLQVDFRVRTDAGHPVVTDFSVAGIWLALEERDQFTAFLGQHGGNIRTLIAHLDDLAKQFR